MTHRNLTRILRGGVALSALALVGAGIAAPAYAQDAAQAEGQAATATPELPTQDESAQPEETIIVTGSLFRSTTSATPSPVTVISAESLDQRGISTTQEAIQKLASANGPSLTNNFTGNGAFAAGASGVSLRGLNSGSTLVLFDGNRAAYYPLADDGTRNFVDLNTIPDDIVERIEVLRDGASSTYGADAIAGVVNVITRRQINGIKGRAEAGVTEDGLGGNQRLSLTAGMGDLDSQGFNAYVSGFYQHSDAVFNRDLPYPFNSSDKRGICFENNCGPNDAINGVNSDGIFPGFDIGGRTLYVRPYNAANTSAQGRYQLLNPNLGCQFGPGYTLSAADLALRDSNGNLVNTSSPLKVCQEDQTAGYGEVTPEINRWGISARGTFTVGDDAEAYLQANFLQSNVAVISGPPVIRGNAPAGFYYPRYSTSATSGVYGNSVLTLPVYVCPERVNCATSPNRTLNPNNPFAAQNQVARLVGLLPNITSSGETRTRSYRMAAGIKGSAFGDWNYAVDLTGMRVDLTRNSHGYVYIQHLLDVIADGSYNFVNPFANTQAQNDYLAPDKTGESTSEVYQAQANLSGKLAELPGGPLQLGFGVAVRYEGVDSPSYNTDFFGPTERYFTLNGFGLKGNRTIYSAYAEVQAPIIDMLEVNASGRYDRYSGGIDNFSPKIGAKFTPIPQLSLRGTYSRGFRIPSFGEANATFPTTGFVDTPQNVYTDAFLAQYGCTLATFDDDCPAYITGARYGQTSLGNPDLKPEKSRSITAGIILEPIRQLTFTVDYYNIRKTGAIATADYGPALRAYYAGQPIPDGYTIIEDAVDTNYSTAKPRIGFIQAPFINANTVRSEGLDFSATGRFKLAEDVRLTSSLEASYVLDLSTTFPDGTTQSYEGTLGNYNLTAGTGTPRTHGSWQNTLEWGPATFTANIDYWSGYNLSAEDQTGPGTAGKCGLAVEWLACDVDSYVTVDFVGSYKVDDRFTFYVNVLNAFDNLPPIDPQTYGAHLYNTVVGGSGILGRSYRAGVRAQF